MADKDDLAGDHTIDPAVPRRDQFESNPRWLVPTMVTFMVVGVIWIATFYITQGDLPIGSIGYWNLGIGLGSIMVGFLLSTRWK